MRQLNASKASVSQVPLRYTLTFKLLLINQMTVSFHLQHQPALEVEAPSLPPLMIPLLPALPTNHHGSVLRRVLRRRKPFCGSSALSASSTTVSPSSKRSRCCGCRTLSCNSICPHKVDTKEERRDSCPATEEEGWPTDRLSSWPRNWRCLQLC